MDKNIQIQLGSTKSINSTNVDTYDKLELNNNRNNILEYDINNILSITEIFERERQNTPVYRVYGGLEYLSILNGLVYDYNVLGDFFKSRSYSEFITTGSYKDIFSSFDFYILRPSGYTRLTDTDNEYVMQLEVVATPDNFEIFKAGYSRNLFNEPKYSFILNKDFDVTNWSSTYSDTEHEFEFPVTELYIYAQYNRASVLNGSETMSGTTWSDDGTSGSTTNIPSNLNVGDIVMGNKIIYNRSNYSQTVEQSQTFYIKTPYLPDPDDTDNKNHLQWKYEPLIPLKLRYFSNEVSRANTGGTTYEEVFEIPEYATHLGDGNMVWRRILDQGYVDPLTGEGVDYPFVNKRRYLFSNVVLNVIPDLNHDNTSDVFSEIKFGNPEALNFSPLGNINNIGQPCQ